MGNCCNCRPIIVEQDEEVHFSEVSQLENPQPKTSIEQREIKKLQLILNVKTWQKESYSLFDYENNQHIKQQQFIINEEGLLIAKNNEVFWQPGIVQKKEEQNESLLLQLEASHDQTYNLVNLHFPRRQFAPETEEQQNKFDLSTIKQQEELSNQLEKQSDNQENQSVQQIPEQKLYFQNKFSINTKVSDRGSKIWLVVKSIQQRHQMQGIKLMVGDYIKLGRIKLIVKQINIIKENQIQLIEKLQQQIQLLIIRDEQQDSIINEDSIQCRVCLSTSKSYDNPLINPCRCSGSMKYIHLMCLINWLKKRAHSHCTDECIILIWKDLECELCKFIYPPIFKSDDRIYNLVELSKPENQSFMMLEFYQKKNQGDPYVSNVSSGIYIVIFDKKKSLRIGRAQDVEININDISVSRMHANLKLIDNDIYISDKKSKFGTLLLLQQRGLQMQISRSLIQFDMQPKETKTSVKFELGVFEKLLGRDQQHIYAQN